MELLALAGAALSAVYGHGPEAWPLAFGEVDSDGMDPEQRKAYGTQLYQYLQVTAASYGRLFSAAAHDEWDDQYDAEVQLAVAFDGTQFAVRGVRPKPL
jgi:hypothetical protein